MQCYMEELLIKKVREHDVLYNFRSFDYRDANMRQEAWEEIGRELNINAVTAKESWEKIRKSFLQAMNRRRGEKNGQAAKKIPPWKFEEQMTFLLPFLKNRRTQDSLPVPLEEYQEYSQQDEPDEDVKSENTERESVHNPEFEDVPGNSNNETFDSLNTLKKRKRDSRNNPIQEMVEVIKGNAALRQLKFLEMQRNEMDATDMFFVSMCKMTKQLPACEQTKIKLILSNAVLNAEMRVEEFKRLKQSLPPERRLSSPIQTSMSPAFSAQEIRLVSEPSQSF